MDKENKRRIMIRMDDLKNETMQEIQRVVRKNSESRKYSTKKEISIRVINRFKEIMAQRGINVNSQYLEGQLDVLVSELESRDKKSDDFLQSQVNRFLNRHMEYAIEDVETDEKKSNLRRNKSMTEEVIDEDKSERKRAADNNQVPKIEGYLHDIFSHTMRMLENRGISISQNDREELQYEILSTLKHSSSEHMSSFFKNDNNKLSENIKRIISYFFEAVNNEISQEEQSEDKKEKKSWELSPSEMENINPEEALKNAENRGNAEQNQLQPIL